jgi:hypothetical protein
LIKDAVLAFATAAQNFKPIARQGSKIPRRRSGFQAVELHPRGVRNSGGCIDPLSGSEISGSLVAEAEDRSLRIRGHYVLRQA